MYFCVCSEEKNDLQTKLEENEEDAEMFRKKLSSGPTAGGGCHHII